MYLDSEVTPKTPTFHTANVDDIRENLLLIEAILKELDVNLIFAESGQEALSQIKDKEIALALLDIHMPLMDGATLADEIQKSSAEIIPIIFITAYSTDEIELENYYKMGVVDFIHKPFRKNILISKVEVFVVLGRTILQKDLDGNSIHNLDVNVTSQIVIVTAKTNNAMLSKKVFVR